MFTRLRPAQMGLVGALSMLPLVLPFSVRAQKPQDKGKPGPATASPKETIKTGRTLFVKNCSPCHGSSGQGGEGPNLQKMTLTDATIGTTIKKGVKGEMPAFGSKFKDGDANTRWNCSSMCPGRAPPFFVVRISERTAGVTVSS